MTQQTANPGFVIWFVVTALLLLLPVYLPVPAGWRHLDKLAHFILFFSGGWLIFPSKFRPLVPAMICWAILVEYLQRFSGARVFSYGDIAWNLIGLGSGILVAVILSRATKNKAP
jgi:VanZ family protein